MITMTGTGKNWNLIKQRCMITMTRTGKNFEKVLNSKSIPPIKNISGLCTLSLIQDIDAEFSYKKVFKRLST